MYKGIGLGYIVMWIVMGCMGYNRVYEWEEIEGLEVGNKKIEEVGKEIKNMNIEMIKFCVLGES